MASTAWIAQAVQPGGPLANLAGIVIGGVGFLAEYARILRPKLQSMTRGIGEWEQMHARIQEVATEKQKENTAKTLLQQQEVQRLTQIVQRAEQQVQQAQERLRQAQQELEEIATGKRLYRFILDRAARKEYQAQLGIVSLIRRDFEELSKLLAKSKEEKPANNLPRIDRIVLYIDDLDRCPSYRVVEVLQAIHLLLAFRLFVVVVGVDSRWLLHALEEEYSAFDAVPAADGNLDQARRAQWATTPKHYLEKIFQIPFTLQPMGMHGYGKLIEDLIPLEQARTSTVVSKGVVKGKGPEPDVRAKSLEEPRQVEEAIAQQPAAEAPAQTEISQADDLRSGKDEPGEATTPEDELTDAELAPEYLEIKPWERMFIQQMDELIPSPRAAKRLVNIYRLIKATISEKEMAAFEGTDKKGGEFQAALLLLGVLTGFSDQAYDLFSAIMRKRVRGSWWKFVARLQPVPVPRSKPRRYRNAVSKDIPEAQVADWEKLRRSLEAQKPFFKIADSLKPFEELSPRVARFSFESGRALSQIMVPMESEAAKP